MSALKWINETEFLKMMSCQTLSLLQDAVDDGDYFCDMAHVMCPLVSDCVDMHGGDYLDGKIEDDDLVLYIPDAVFDELKIRSGRVEAVMC